MRNFLCTAALAALFVSTSAAAAPANVSALQGTITYKNSASTGPQYYSPFARVTSKVVYDSATGTYTLRDTGNPALISTFGPANVTGSNAAFTFYSKTSGTNVETLRLLNKSGANPLIVLTLRPIWPVAAVDDFGRRYLDQRHLRGVWRAHPGQRHAARRKRELHDLS